MFDLYKKILNFSPKLFSGNANKSVIGIDIGSSSIKVVEVRKKGGKAILETYGVVSLGPYANTDIGRVTNLSVEKIVQALKEVLKQSGVATNFASLSIPMQSSLVFNMELSSEIAESELASVVSIEARKYVPMPINEVSLDYFILPKRELSFEEVNTLDGSRESSKKTEVLVVAIHNDAISKYRSIVSECQLETNFFEVEIFSSVRANFEHELSLVLLVDIGASLTRVSLIDLGVVKDYHTINRGGAEFSDSISRSLGITFDQAEKIKKEYGLFENPNYKDLTSIIKVHLDYIFSKMNDTILGYEKKYNKSVTKIIFSGGGSLLKGLQEIAATNFQAEIEIGHPFTKVYTPVFLEKVFKSIDPEFAVALGLALRQLK
ncbi:MAG: type IV pilus assembly protein PilM [Patescibacteria group bacterium]